MCVCVRVCVCTCVCVRVWVCVVCVLLVKKNEEQTVRELPFYNVSTQMSHAVVNNVNNAKGVCVT